MPKYSKKAQESVKRAMRKRKKGTLKSSSGRKVTSKKQAIAIGLSEAREKGAKVPKKKKEELEHPGKSYFQYGEEEKDTSIANPAASGKRGENETQAEGRTSAA